MRNMILMGIVMCALTMFMCACTLSFTQVSSCGSSGSDLVDENQSPTNEAELGNVPSPK